MWFVSEEVQSYTGRKEFCFSCLTSNLQITWPCRYCVTGKSLTLIGMCFEIIALKHVQGRTKAKGRELGKKVRLVLQGLFSVTCGAPASSVEVWTGCPLVQMLGNSPLDLPASLARVGSPWCGSRYCLLLECFLK